MPAQLLENHSEKLDAPVLVLTDHSGNAEQGYVLSEASKQILTLAHAVTNQAVDAVALNDSPDTQALTEFGVRTVYAANLTSSSARVGAAVVDAALAAFKADAYGLILNVANYRGREVAAGLAVKLHTGVAADVTECVVQDGKVVAAKPVLAGAWNSIFEVRGTAPVVSVRPSSVEAKPQPAPAATNVEPLDITYSDSARAVSVDQSVPEASSGNVPLTEADVVVVGGRGVGGDFTAAQELADLLGGAVGATRVACDEEWIDRTAQVGQTGVSIAPKLYIGLGVSGAIHHVTGIQAAEKIVAICDDPDAPIFEIADLGIVGTVQEVVPDLIERLRKRL